MTRRARRTLAIVLFAHAAGLGATSMLAEPDRMYVAIVAASGILAAVLGAAALGLAAFELRVFQERGDP